ncbi:MAG TPA: AAA-like domain-containing protein [Microcoleaceae cyanobacterium]|jgi:serine/threonine-protein kinase
MDVKEALELADRLIYQHTGKRLNDLEREVFIGSWEGRTYDEIYPLNPEYVEKSVGYKLWQRLSTVCGEKVTKKKFRGALERIAQQQALNQANLSLKKSRVAQHIFLSYRNQEPDRTLANQLYQALAAAGHQVIITVPNDLANEHVPIDRWLTQIYANLQQCDYFLLLLSSQAAVSEMVIEELRQVTLLQDISRTRCPIVLPIRVGYLPDDRLNHDLRNYLQDIHLLDWDSAGDTEQVIQTVLDCINGQKRWGGGEGDEGKAGGEGKESRQVVSSSPLSPSSPPPAPTPVADPELPQGQVRLDSAFYVERSPYEAQCYREILQPGTLIRIKAPRQMGKTSLMSRILQQAREQGYATVPLSFQHADAGVFANLNQFLQWFCSRIARKLRSPHSVDQYWSDTFGSKDNCTAYFEDCLLSEIDPPLVLGLDEVDRIFQYPTIADDFFGLLRAWYEEAGYGDSGSGLWEKLRLVIVHSTEVYIPLDVNQSPFNVGLPIELSEFSPEQVLDLAERHRLNWQFPQVDQLMRIVGGHPYLIRLAFYHLAQQHLTLTELLATAPTEAGIYGDHLRRHLWNLQQHPKLSAALGWVVAADEPIELESVLAFKLHSLGLVQLHGNRVTSRFELYRQYFSERLAQR